MEPKLNDATGVGIIFLLVSVEQIVRAMKACSPELELREEKANAITHVAGILFGLVSVPFLILNACKTCGHYVIAGISMYGLSFLMVFTFSTIFHLQKEGRRRHLSKIF